MTSQETENNVSKILKSKTKKEFVLLSSELMKTSEDKGLLTDSVQFALNRPTELDIENGTQKTDLTFEYFIVLTGFHSTCMKG